MPNRYGIVGEVTPAKKIRASWKAIVGGLIAGVSGALSAAQGANVEGTTIGLAALVSAAVSAAAIWWTRNVTDDTD